MNLNVSIHKIKSVEDLNISFPLEKGLYAITGQNGSGKSTIVTCASRAFYSINMEDYFGESEEGAFVKCSLNDIYRHWIRQNNTWKHSSNGKMEIKGFYEGSLIFGNRFRNASYDKLKRVLTVSQTKLLPADDFIRKNLGIILQRDENYYEKLWYVSGADVGLRSGYVFYYEKNGKRISQYHMSTGENLLISILNSINIRNNDRESVAKPCLLFLDEIELALHPASLIELISFLQRISEEFNYAIYFSTHSIELISRIDPEKIFYLERHSDNSLEVINPCWPAYATKFLYDHTGYDNVILVEDDLAREIIRRILRKERLMNNKLVHVMPCGGYTNVLDLADDVTKNNLLGNRVAVCVILDGDIKDEAEKYVIRKNLSRNLPLNYLPIPSLEKYLRNNLYLHVDHGLLRFLNNYLYQHKSIEEIIDYYKKDQDSHHETDNNGKSLFKLLDEELKRRSKSRSDLIEMVVDYLFDSNDDKTAKIAEFLRKQLEDF